MRIFILLFALSSFTAHAGDVQDLMNRCHESLRGETQWSWNVVRVRTILELGIRVPLLTSFNVNPEIELYFVKQ